MFRFTTAAPLSRQSPYLKPLLGWLLLLLGGAGVVALVEAAEETEVKAVYVYNFASFVSWPKATMEARMEQPFLVCALGKDRVTELLPRVVAGEQVGGRAMRFLKLERDSQAAACEILYLAGLDASRSTTILQQLQDLPVLTVSDQPGFAQRGGHIELSLRANRIHPVINRRGVQRSALRISAKLYRLATILDSR